MDFIAQVATLFWREPILAALFVLAIVIWSIIGERLWFFYFDVGTHRTHIARLGRSASHQWELVARKRQMIGQLMARAQARLRLLVALVGVAPILGLLRTVSAIIDILNELDLNGDQLSQLPLFIGHACMSTLYGMTLAVISWVAVCVLRRKLKRVGQLCEYLAARPF